MKIKTIQMSLFLSFITSIVTKDNYIVAKLPPNVLGKDVNDYWARPYPWAQQQTNLKPEDTTGKLVEGICSSILVHEVKTLETM